ncbi:MAG: ATP-dependent DNA helicase RecG [Polaribacter sp.]|jgi:ATP-dependent DNA helicase RecG
MKLSQISVETLKGVGVKVAEKLANLGIISIEDLLFHLPSRYQDRSRIHPIASLLHGQTAQVFGEVESADIVFGKKRSLICKISDGSGILDIRLFFFSMAQKKAFVRGTYVQVYGQVFRMGKGISMIHPEIKYLKNQSTPKLENGLQAVYPTTQGLQQRTFHSIVKQAIQYLDTGYVKELLPEKLLQKLNFPSLTKALRLLHQPPLNISLEDIHSGEHPLIQRLAFEELMAQHLSMRHLKLARKALTSHAINFDQKTILQFINQLSFELTNAQNKVIKEIRNDLIQPSPMSRLVQGDVGCGKTLVAALSMLPVAKQGLQAVIMAPTEILAVQHGLSFKNWFAPLGIKVVLLVSKMKSKEQKEALELIKNGHAKIIVGTHAVFQKRVLFNQLALVVIDEQHRFGVEQRKMLLDKALNNSSDSSSNDTIQKTPHQLVMTATPIPRTLAQTAYADLDLSIIDELPPGRKPIETSVVSDLNREKVVERIRSACLKDKRQVYWVCTLIEESEEIPSQAAENAFELLKEQLPELKIGLIHGRLKPAEKQSQMSAFKSAELDILVATTVIEVGVDVPNASLMIIENPERLGLSQLHQLRGRVGRGEKASFCLLMYHAPLSQNAKQRLQVMRENNDGFIIAEKDLEIRGAGEVLGTRQTGEMLFKFADLLRDRKLLPLVQQNVTAISENHPQIAKEIRQRWVKKGEQLSHV